LLQDIWLIEKLAHFDREVIPERRMHAKGWGAYPTPANTGTLNHSGKDAIGLSTGLIGASTICGGSSTKDFSHP
jgi:catalase